MCVRVCAVCVRVRLAVCVAVLAVLVSMCVCVCSFVSLRSANSFKCLTSRQMYVDDLAVLPPVLAACCSGDAAGVEAWLALEEADVNRSVGPQSQRTFLHYAILFHQLDVAKALLLCMTVEDVQRRDYSVRVTPTICDRATYLYICRFFPSFLSIVWCREC